MSDDYEISKQLERERREKQARRDMFAAAALNGLLANGDWTEESCAVMAGRIASALIAELDKE